MPPRPLRALLRRVRRLRRTAAGRVSDAALLGRFGRGDEAAFELLVWRHGPLVLGACRRVLRHEQDAEDAFQATFLTLARRAGTAGRRGSLAGWLYTVARRVALRARERRGGDTDLARLPSGMPADVSPLLVRGAVRLARLVAAGEALTGPASPAALGLAPPPALSVGTARIKRWVAPRPSSPPPLRKADATKSRPRACPPGPP